MQSSTKQDYLLWCLLRQANTANIPQTELSHDEFVPSFIATKSLLEKTNKQVTLVAFIPIIPSPATEADTIYTCMKDFQDVLIQKNLAYGSLWSDEGVYRIAKEIQLLNPEEFTNIFLDWKTSIIGQFLKESGIEEIFIKNEIFGINVVKSVMDGGHYVRSKRGFALVEEIIQKLQILHFIKSAGKYNYEIFKQVQELYHSFQR